MLALRLSSGVDLPDEGDTAMQNVLSKSDIEFLERHYIGTPRRTWSSNLEHDMGSSGSKHPQPTVDICVFERILIQRSRRITGIDVGRQRLVAASYVYLHSINNILVAGDILNRTSDSGKEIVLLQICRHIEVAHIAFNHITRNINIMDIDICVRRCDGIIHNEIAIEEAHYRLVLPGGID